MEGVKMDRGDEEMEESGDGSGMEEEMPKQAFHVSIPRCINNNTAGGTWPIPEGYLLTDQHQQHAINQSQSKLRARSAQPVIKFYSFFPPVPLTFPFTNSKSCNSILKGFLVDKYQIERCELTDWLLKYKRGFPYLCFIPGSSIRFASCSFSFSFSSLTFLPLFYFPSSSSSSLPPYPSPSLPPRVFSLSSNHSFLRTRKM